MPCHVEPTYGERYAAENAMRDKANAATRAACDLARIVKAVTLLQNATQETQRWVAAHEAEDAARLVQEAKKQAAAELKYRALAKLDQDERRALGL